MSSKEGTYQRRNLFSKGFFYGYSQTTTPLFDWGKYYEKDGKVMIPISVQAHHSFVDGLHIGLFVEQLQKFLNEC